MSKEELEEGLVFTPRFDADGLIPCITQCAQSGDILMFAYMNETALQKTIESGEAYYWSRSRNELWHKGASSGLTQKVVELRTDCDQDCILMKVSLGGEVQASCHTGRKSCFYRSVALGQNEKPYQMEFKDADKLFDPKDVYSSDQ